MEEANATGDIALFWGVFGVAAVLITGVEMMALNRIALRSVHALAHAAGLDALDRDDEDDAYRVAAALARAALELPNPPDALLGVDPRRDASPLRLLVFALVYRLKVSVTNFVLKMLVRRLAGRAALRAWIPFVAVPVTAAWDAVVCWWVLREARIRTMGPSAAQEHVDRLLSDGPELTPAGREGVFRAVACSIVSKRDLHPNLAAMLRFVHARLETPERPQLDDREEFLAALPALSSKEQDVILALLCLAGVLDGRLSRRERRLCEQAHAACGRAITPERLNALRRQFVAGDSLDLG